MTRTMFLKEVRENLNISQSEMAKFLKIPRSQISMVELGQRPISPEALMRLVHLQQCSETTNQLSSETSNALAERESMIHRDLLKKYKDRLELVCWTINRQARYLETLQSEWDKNLQLARATEKLSETAADISTTDYYRAYIRERSEYAQRKMAETGDVRQMSVKFKIELLTAEASILEKYISGK